MILGLGFFWPEPLFQPVQESQTQKFQRGGWSSRLRSINKAVPVKHSPQGTAVWGKSPSSFQRAGLALATLLSKAGHGYSYSAAAATHTG